MPVIVNVIPDASVLAAKPLDRRTGLGKTFALIALGLSSFGFLATLHASPSHADDPVFSGPQAGELLPPLKLRGVYDDASGKEFDPVAQADGKPILLVFVHKLTRPGLGLARGLTNYAKTLDEPPHEAAIVWLHDDQAEAEAYLTRARPSLNLQVPVGISVDGGEGPGAYGLNRNVELTVLVAKDNKVVANFALIQPSLTDGVKIAGEFAKALGKAPPTAEELQKAAYPGRDGKMRRRMRARE
ncbi:hypothetical protein Mal15_33600 [Stieleria maiorica]|uniref:Thioredoxin domain-containing protein n=1 Tax=Stieleria maiorica TaxID=2795974 RepID=A0A5B9MGQ3_9BACT|nr:hypothetical protein [Stieleria maiorica]QEF99296.1 hypothetical protein Mal15_33600 [Stieleria maiorica]